MMKNIKICWYNIMINSNKLLMEIMSRLQDELHRIYLRIVIVQTQIDELDKKISERNKLIDDQNKNKKQ